MATAEHIWNPLETLTLNYTLFPSERNNPFTSNIVNSHDANPAEHVLSELESSLYVHYSM